MIEPHAHSHNHVLKLVIDTGLPSTPTEALWAYWQARLAGAPLSSPAE